MTTLGGSVIRGRSDIDRGWAWVVLVASVFNMLFVGMINYGSGVIYMVLTDTFPESDTVELAWISGLPSSLSAFMGPVAGCISTFGSCRLSIFLGGFLCFVGFASSAFVTSLGVLFITLGAIAGTGLGLIYTPSFAVIGFYFDKKRDLASGIEATGCAIGSIIGPFMFMALYNYYGRGGMFLMLGALFFHPCALAMLMWPSSLERYQRKYRKNLLQRSADKTMCNTVAEHFKILGNRSFIWLIVSILLWGTGCGGIVLHLPTYTLHSGAEEWEQSLFWVIFGCCAIASRIIAGCVSSFHPVIKYYEYPGSFVVLAIATFFLPFYVHTVGGRLGYASMLGICVSISYALLTSLTVEQVGLHNLPMALGIEMMICGIGHLIGPPIGASVIERTGEHRNIMWYFAGFLMASSICGVGMLICKPSTLKEDLNVHTDDGIHSFASLSGVIECSMESITHSIHISPAPATTPILEFNRIEVAPLSDIITSCTTIKTDIPVEIAVCK